MGVGAGLYIYDVVVKKFTFAISSPDEFLFTFDQVITIFYNMWIFSIFENNCSGF